MTKHQKDTLFLDGIRGFAAFYVMVGHARWLLWEGYSEGYLTHPETYSKLQTMFVYFLSLFRYGHEAVLLFFVLSGFVIHLRYSNKIQNEGSTVKFDTIPFFKRRIKRIYPPFLLAILVTFILDTVGKNLNFPIYASNTVYETLNENIIPNHSSSTIFGNLFFLMRFYTPVFGTNGPLWSLAYEWWFYMFYPVLFYMGRSAIKYGLITISLLYIFSVTIGFNIILLDKIFTLLPTWWLGTLLADIYSKRSKIRFKYLIPFTLILLILPLEIINIPLSGAKEILWAVGFAGFFSLCFQLQSKGKKNWFIHLKPLGDISYSLYVIHMPIMVFLSGYILQKTGNQLLPKGYTLFFIGVGLSIIAGVCSYYIAEKPFIKKKSVTK